MAQRAVIELNLVKEGRVLDLDVPLDINAGELMEGLNEAYALGLSPEEIAACHVKAENPVVLMHGKKTLAQYGIMNGSVVIVSE